MRPEYIIYPNEKITKAITFAAEAHHCQYRKGSDIPYIFHPISVGRILIENDCIETVVIAGILHDVIEDTDTEPKEIKSQFGEKVLKYVLAVSEPNKDDPWESRKRQYIKKAKTASLRILQIMCADKLDNLSQIKRDFDRVGDEVWERFNSSKDQIKWYYSSLIDIFNERFTRHQDIELTQKLEILKEEVFNER